VSSKGNDGGLDGLGEESEETAMVVTFDLFALKV